MTNRDPFAEEEIEYTGPKKASAPEPFDDAYTFDGDDDGPDFTFDSDDEPDDWTPPVTPAASATRQFTGGEAPALPTRPARTKTTAPSAVITLPDETFVPQETTPDESPAPEEDTAPSSPRRRPAPDVPQSTNKSLKDRLLALFRGRPVDPDDEEMRAITRKIHGTVNIAFINRKGGVGKTLTTTLTGQTLATHRRGDRVIAIDSSPEGGELCDRVELEQFGSMRSLHNQLDTVSRYSHIRSHTSLDPSGLEVLGSDPDAVGEPPLTGDEYRSIVNTLRDHYSVILTDCAQGLSNSVMEAVLEETDILVVVSEGADGMRSATWVASQLADPEGLFKGRFAHLVDDMIVVVTQRSARTNVDTNKVAEHFETFARRVIQLPYDQALEGGRPFALDEVEASTRQAGLDIAAAITTSAGFLDGGR